MQRVAPRQDTTILDIGSSDEEGLETNMLEQLYPWPEQITAAGLGQGLEFSKRFASRYVQIVAGKPLPFSDEAFDVVWSNAVLEHVGGLKERAEFIADICRVARRAFIIVPNRWFPIEHHTAVPLLHWSAPLFRRLLRGTSMDFWTHPRNMDFLSRHSLSEEFPQAKGAYGGFWLGPLSSNLVLIF
jgi:SAM-dependent methyltransferase